MRAPLAAAAFGVLLALAACGGEEGGCGGAPAKEEPARAQTAGPSGGGSAGSGSVALKKKPAMKTRRGKESDAETAKEQLVEAEAEATARAAAPLPAVGNRSFEGRVLKAKKPVLVFVAGDGCEECAWAAPAVDRAAARRRAEWDSYTLDAFSTGATGLLPGDMKPLPLPKLILYEGGKAFSRREGLPFPRDTGEPLADYQKRLTRWLSAALAQKDLSFGAK